MGTLKTPLLYPPLTEEQKKAIDYFKNNPPRYYKWFYKMYTKWIGNLIFFTIVGIGALMIIFNDAIFDVVKGLFFFVMGLGLWALSAYLFKHFYTKRYAKKIGMTLKQWNYWTKGLTLNV